MALGSSAPWPLPTVLGVARSGWGLTPCGLDLSRFWCLSEVYPPGSTVSAQGCRPSASGRAVGGLPLASAVAGPTIGIGGSGRPSDKNPAVTAMTDRPCLPPIGLRGQVDTSGWCVLACRPVQAGPVPSARTEVGPPSLPVIVPGKVASGAGFILERSDLQGHTEGRGAGWLLDPSHGTCIAGGAAESAALGEGGAQRRRRPRRASPTWFGKDAGHVSARLRARHQPLTCGVHHRGSLGAVGLCQHRRPQRR